MPIYDYRCLDCGKMMEVLVRSDDVYTTKCSVCDSENTERLLSASYMIKTERSPSGTTCCGSRERCDTPPCSTGEKCHRA